MKEVHLTGAERVEHQGDVGKPTSTIDAYGDDLHVSDGFHTFDELYEHRIALFIALAQGIANAARDLGDAASHLPPVWRSKLHDDGPMYPDQFIMGIGKEKGEQITYHIPIEQWDETDFAETLEHAPEWDLHTSKDVLDRLKTLL